MDLFTLNTRRLITGAILLLILGPGKFPGITLAQTYLPDDPTKGARLFGMKGCVKCHALRGEGGKSGPDLGRVDLGETQLDLAARLLNHIPSMLLAFNRTKFIRPSLTGEDLQEISTYLYFLKVFDESGNALRGSYLFKDKGCQICHPLSGTGKEGASGLDRFPQNLSPVFLSQSIWNHGPDMIAQMEKLGMKWPEFKGTEMMDLLEYIKGNAKGSKEIAYLAPGNPRQGRKVFVEKGCTTCHPVRGEGGKGGADLGKKSKAFYKSLTQIASTLWNKGPLVMTRMSSPRSGIPKFTSREMADLLTYLYFLHFADERGDAAKGMKVFSALGCSQCHSIEGKAGKIMQISLSKFQRDSNLMEIVAGIWNHNVEIEKAMKEKGLSWPRFKRGDLADLLEFIRKAEK